MLFCPECGNKLSGTESFCNECGTRVTPEAAPAVADPVIPAEYAEDATVVVPEAAPVAEDIPAEIDIPVDEPVVPEEPEEPVFFDEAEEPEEPAAPKQPVSENYSTPVVPVEKPKKKKSGKLLLILIPIIVVVLLVGAAVGVWFWAGHTHEQAMACLQEKNYEEALELFNKFSFINKDSEEMAAQLERLQNEYDDAKELLAENKFIEAQEILAELGDYRDSMVLTTSEVPYQQAMYLMQSAADDNGDALAQHPTYDETAAYDRSSQILLYEGAADLLEELGEYEDSAAQYSKCYREIATLYMTEDRFEEAMACQAYMSEADAESFLEEYKTYCVDEDVLAALAESVYAREEMEELYADDPYMTDLDLVETEAAILEPFTEEGLMYFDPELEELVQAYLAGLLIEASVIEDDGYFSFDNYATWYTGNAARYAVIETLIEKYDFLGDDPSFQEYFAGSAEYYAAAAVLEQALLDQLIGVTAEEDEEAGYYLVFENTTGYAFDFVLTNEFCDAEYNTIFYHETDPVHIGVGETVNLYFQFPETDEWENWFTNWYYDIIIP